MTSLLKNGWALAAMVALCWALVASSAFGYYYYQFTDLVARIGGTPVSVNLSVDYANGTRRWFNGTIGATLYDAMVRAGWDVEASSFGVMGLYVTSINGLGESTENSRYWSWWTWTDYGWSHGGAACDKYVLGASESIIWYYSYTNTTTWIMDQPP